MTDILPAAGTPWPPTFIANAYGRMPRKAAWLGGDKSQLAAAYGADLGSAEVIAGGPGTTLNPGGRTRAASVGAQSGTFWGSVVADEVDTKRHLPIAQDIATLSSELLFSDPPTIKVLGPMEPDGSPTLETKAAQLGLEQALDKCGFQSTLLAAAEISSALGYAGLRIAFDKTQDVTSKRPVIARADADNCIPVYSWGQLVGVIFWSVVEITATGKIRHLEAHTGGAVYHGLYRGDDTDLGERLPLTASPKTVHLAELIATSALNADGGVILDAAGGKTATSIPNMLPDPLDRQSFAGRSDYTPAVQDLMDAADRVYSEFMESIDDAKSRILVGASLLENKGAGKGVTFNSNRRFFTPLNMPPAEREGGLPIDKVQFEMHVAEYISAMEWLRDQAVQAAGYNSQSNGTDSEGPITATQFAGEAKRSMSTRDKKVRYWDTELEDLLTTYLRVYVDQFSPSVLVPGEPGDAEGVGATQDQIVKIQAYPVQVTFPEAVQPTQAELAATAQALSAAKAASSFILVKTVHPDWTDTQVQVEVDRIKADTAAPVDPVTFGASGAGVGAGDSLFAPQPGAQGQPAPDPATVPVS